MYWGGVVLGSCTGELCWAVCTGLLVRDPDTDIDRHQPEVTAKGSFTNKRYPISRPIPVDGRQDGQNGRRKRRGARFLFGWARGLYIAPVFPVRVGVVSVCWLVVEGADTNTHIGMT